MCSYIFSFSNVRGQAEARFGADSLDPLVGILFFLSVSFSAQVEQYKT